MTSVQPSGGKVLLGLSGGISSAVTGALLKAQGFDLVGLHLQSENPQLPKHCFQQNRTASLEKISKKLDIDVMTMDTSEAYDAYVVDEYVHSVLRSWAYDPCMTCHRAFKLEFLFSMAQSLGCEYVATGHYAQLVTDLKSQAVRLYRAADESLDQSKYLTRLAQDKMRRLVCPLGGLNRIQVERLAYQMDFPIEWPHCSSNPEAWLDMIPQRVPAELLRVGPVRNEEGHQIGHHTGIYRQSFRSLRGLTFVGKEQKATGYVTAVDEEEPAVTVCQRPHPGHKDVKVKRLNWVQNLEPYRDQICFIQTREQKTPIKCRVIFYENQTAQVHCESPLQGVWPGEWVTFSSGNELLGSGVITLTVL